MILYHEESLMQTVVNHVGKMLLQLSSLTHIPTHICFYIWSLLLEAWSLEIKDGYCLTDIDAIVREIASHSWDPYWLGT